MTEEEIEACLVIAAKASRDRAVATYSHFRVGAALETIDGEIVTGCNIENATFGLTICAERVALFKAISEGKRHFLRLCIVGDGAKTITPCGSCRQLLWEFAGDILLLLTNAEKVTHKLRLSSLFPLPFDSESL